MIAIIFNEDFHLHISVFLLQNISDLVYKHNIMYMAYNTTMDGENAEIYNI